MPQLVLDIALITALGIGLMMGIVRERTHKGDNAVAGVRTHALVSLAGFVAMELGVGVYAAALFSLGLLAYGSYRMTAEQDPGLTGEVALLVNALLAGLAHSDSATAASLGVVVTALLYAKPSLQHISRNWLVEGELNDALMVAAAALVVLPMLPTQALDPWGVVRLDVLWRVVVLIMAISVLGHWAQRLLGPRWGPRRRVLPAAVGPSLLQAPWQELLFQGVGSVVISGITFTQMVRYFGPVRSTMITSLVPGLSALGAVVFLGERMSGRKWIAVLRHNPFQNSLRAPWC